MHSYIFPNFQGHGSIQQVNDKQQCYKNIDDLQKIAMVDNYWLWLITWYTFRVDEEGDPADDNKEARG